MPRDSQGAYNLPAGTLVNSGDTVLVSQHNPAFQDVATALTNSVDRDGKGGMRAPLNMGGNRVANAAPGVNPTDLATVAQSSVPVGGVLDFAGSVAPDGYLMCYGQAISRSAYSLLFAAIGTTYGTGDGSTTFNVPDARGRVSAGKDDMGGTSANRLTSPVNGDTLGAAGGAEGVSLTTAQLAAHSHSITDPGHEHGMPGAVTVGGGLGSGAAFGQATISSQTATTGITINNAGSGDAHNNVQPTIIFNKIIKTGNS